MNNFSNRTLIDKIVLYSDKVVKEFKDYDLLVEQGHIEVMTNSNGHCISEIGQRYDKFKVKGNTFKEFVSGYDRLHKRNLTTLTLTINDDVTENLFCFTVDEYKNRLKAVEEELNSLGIIVDLSGLNISYIELNKTFKLKGKYSEYDRVFRLILQSLKKSMKIDQDKKFKSCADYISGSTTSYRAKKRTSNGRYKEIQIYNKGASVKNSLLQSDNVVRIELKLSGSETVRETLGTKKFDELTDRQIENCYNTQTEKLIIKPMSKWKEEVNKELITGVEHYKATNGTFWKGDFLLDVSNKELCGNIVLLDLKHLKEVLKMMKFSNNTVQNYVKSFRNHCEKSRDKHIYTLSHSDKLDEVLNALKDYTFENNDFSIIKPRAAEVTSENLFTNNNRDIIKRNTIISLISSISKRV